MGTPMEEAGIWLGLPWEDSGILAGSCGGEEAAASLAVLKDQRVSRSTWVA